jgi:pyroglutamyl-peptidase
MTRVLLTGFEPFGGEAVNSSWEAVSRVTAEPLPGLDITTALLPCVFGEANEALYEQVRRTAPELVVCVGQAGGRAEVSVERVAINVDDARIPDNRGQRPIDRPVVAGGPAAYFSALPIKRCALAIRDSGAPAAVSQTAGTYLCNHVFYGLMHLIATELPDLRGGFVHVPLTPEQANASVRAPGRAAPPSLPAEAVAEGLRAMLTAAATERDDLAIAEGATH